MRRRWPKSKPWPARPTGEAGDMLAFQAAMLADAELARPAFESDRSRRVGAARRGRTQWPPRSPVTRPARTPISRARAADLEDIRDRVLGHFGA